MNLNQHKKSSTTDIYTIEEELKNLTQEARDLFEVLDNHSSLIRSLENELQELKANFPFRFEVGKEETHESLYPKESHENIVPNARGYYSLITWFLSWDIEENSKKFRLCLLAEETEIVLYDHPADEGCLKHRLAPITIFKKPLIETSLSQRLKYAEFLAAFVRAFKDYLSDYRFTILNEHYHLVSLKERKFRFQQEPNDILKLEDAGL